MNDDDWSRARGKRWDEDTLVAERAWATPPSMALPTFDVGPVRDWVVEHLLAAAEVLAALDDPGLLTAHRPGRGAGPRQPDEEPADRHDDAAAA